MSLLRDQIKIILGVFFIYVFQGIIFSILYYTMTMLNDESSLKHCGEKDLNFWHAIYLVGQVSTFNLFGDFTPRDNTSRVLMSLNTFTTVCTGAVGLLWWKIYEYSYKERMKALAKNPSSSPDNGRGLIKGGNVREGVINVLKAIISPPEDGVESVSSNDSVPLMRSSSEVSLILEEPDG